MFEKSQDDRISHWAKFRKELENSDDPYDLVWKYWKNAPYIPYNNRIDPYFQRSWPTPWQIIVDNRYDDFTKALMIGWTLKLLDRFKFSKIELKTLVDKEKSKVYNIVVVNEEIAINYDDNGPVSLKEVSDLFFLENLIELKRPR